MSLSTRRWCVCVGNPDWIFLVDLNDMLSVSSYGSYSGQPEGQASPLPDLLLFFGSIQHLKSTKCFLFYRAMAKGIMALLEDRATVALDSKLLELQV